MSSRHHALRGDARPRSRSYPLASGIASQLPPALLALSQALLIRDIRGVFGCGYATAWRAVKIAGGQPAGFLR